jgi:hypothetical protein
VMVRVPAVGRVAVLIREAPGRMAVPPTRAGSCFSRFACGRAACEREEFGQQACACVRACWGGVVKTARRAHCTPRSARRGGP